MILTVELPAELAGRIAEYCAEEGRELSTFMMDAATAWLDDDEHAMLVSKLRQKLRLSKSSELQVVCPSCGAEVIVGLALKS